MALTELLCSGAFVTATGVAAPSPVPPREGDPQLEQEPPQGAYRCIMTFVVMAVWGVPYDGRAAGYDLPGRPKGAKEAKEHASIDLPFINLDLGLFMFLSLSFSISSTSESDSYAACRHHAAHPPNWPRPPDGPHGGFPCKTPDEGGRPHKHDTRMGQSSPIRNDATLSPKVAYGCVASPGFSSTKFRGRMSNPTWWWLMVPRSSSRVSWSTCCATQTTGSVTTTTSPDGSR